MLEKLSDPACAAISIPDRLTVQTVKEFAERNPYPVVAEIGVGVGATSVELARAFGNRGELHLFDFEGRVSRVIKDLEQLGFRNAIGYENWKRHGVAAIGR